MSLLYVDLETTVYTETITEEEFLAAVPGSYKKEESIQKYLTENKDAITKKIIKKRSLDPFQCKIVCISYSFNGSKPQAITGSEEYILERFQREVNEHLVNEGGSITGISLVGHNIKKFDGPILYLRACRYNLDSLKQLLYFTRKEIHDTMEMGSYYVYGNMVALDVLCKFFGVDTPKDEMDGSMVFQYYKDGRIEEIAKYCNKDVEALINVYDKLSI